MTMLNKLRYFYNYDRKFSLKGIEKRDIPMLEHITKIRGLILTFTTTFMMSMTDLNKICLTFKQVKLKFVYRRGLLICFRLEFESLDSFK